ncbi:hypothetical protein GCM10010404_70520 [Nonomuraea africana]|uniref:Uncharacterized protein n=1 Tax=Nonomuraea africana TaxID=46171 RepID=A0ABR9KPJ2_9ACTN|nr:hypothetical protein [Nonomuraea africana]MBE1563945.1 hypothetical protein [Nonomuraea africana]
MSDPWDAIDDQILAERIVQALMIIRDHFGGTLHEAIDRFSERYEYLRETRPNYFIKPHGEYGRDFYS